jgi:hypothetical protein
MGIVIHVKTIKGKEMHKDAAMELEQSIGQINQVMKGSGFRDIVMVTAFTHKNQAKNIVANGKMMFVTAKVNGLMQMEE